MMDRDEIEEVSKRWQGCVSWSWKRSRAAPRRLYTRGVPGPCLAAASENNNRFLILPQHISAQSTQIGHWIYEAQKLRVLLSAAAIKPSIQEVERAYVDSKNPIARVK